MPFTTHYRQKTELFFVTRLPTSQEYGSFFGSYERSKRNKIHFVTKFTGIKVKFFFSYISIKQIVKPLLPVFFHGLLKPKNRK